jgi:hypothetical protein
MKTQIKKNMETLMEEMERLSAEPITTALAERLSAYRGAYKALCMVDSGEYTVEEETHTEAAGKARTASLSGNTEFDRVIMATPADYEHMLAIMEIISDHMQSLRIMNARAYDNIMLRLQEVARH